ncbi:conserved hypothetical protein [Ricinus communis]|uniref:Uncharacterized protein n=1 Tax=Ricinus communis TaxID=3988 RepID=B9SH69_RICCO|nr:conserved hypothetical protein [Ricinus communis]
MSKAKVSTPARGICRKMTDHGRKASASANSICRPNAGGGFDGGNKDERESQNFKSLVCWFKTVSGETNGRIKLATSRSYQGRSFAANDRYIKVESV